MTTNNLKLYHYWRSSCSWRVRWALELKGISYDEEIIDLKTGVQAQLAFTQKSPSGFVPCLQVPGQGYLNDSIAMIEWLDESYKGTALLPSSAWQRAKTRELAAIVASGTQPLQNLFVLREIEQLGGARASWAQMVIARGLKAFEQSVQSSAGSFAVGSQVSLADLCLIPQVYNAHRFKVAMDQFPTCEKIYRHALTTDACQRSAPENQTGADS